MATTDQSGYLGEEKISRLLLKFAIPCVLSLLISALYNIVDQIFIGNSDLGYLGNAATSVVFPITIISLAFAWCFGDGSAAYLSMAQGRKDTQHAHKCVGGAMTASFAAGLLFALVCALFMDSILYAFGASAQTIGLARDYFTIILAAVPLFMVMNTISAVVRADGSPGYSMMLMLTGAVINLVLDPLFIFVCHWGIKGAAWATIIGQIVSFVLALLYFRKSKTFKLTWRSFIPDFALLGNTAKLGASTFITQMSIVVISLVCNIMLVTYGRQSPYGQDIPIAVIGIAMKVFTIVINIVVGIILGGQPILGYNYGAKKYGRVKETFRLIVIATVIVGILSTLIFELCPQIVINLFGVEPGLYDEFAQMTFRTFLALVTFTCAIKMSSIFFQAVGQPVKAAVISLTRDIVCFVPLVILLPLAMGIEGTLWAAPAADIIGIIVTVIFVVSFFKSLSRRSAQTDAPEAITVISPSKPGVIVAISREHGSAGKHIGQLVAERLEIPFYCKEITALAAQESGLASEFVSNINANAPTLMHELYLSTEVVQQAIIAQEKILRKIADNGSCVIVGRAADYVLRDYGDVVRIFIHAQKAYRVKMVMEMYGDTEQEGKKSISRSDAARATYYKNISGADWGAARQYELCIDSSIGAERTANAIVEYLRSRQ
ncbi:MAG: MATE family efflux transporter [Oscillospiraceae bacterium]|jgi:putative MATE family efflux protein|nr:MATE family efflux transporter [Oscillospiraceae bacterium]